MTSTPVTNQSTFFMDVTKADTPRSDGKGMDFSDAMNKARKDETKTQPKEESPKAMTSTKVEKSGAAQERISKKTEDADAVQSPEEKPEMMNAEQEITEVVEEAVMTMMVAVADELEIPVEDLESKMEELAIEPEALLNAKEIPEILTKLTDEPDVMSLVTDENLYESLKTLTDLSKETEAELAETLNVPKEEVPKVIESLKEEVTEKTAEPEPVQMTVKKDTEANDEIEMPKEEMPKTETQPAEVKSETDSEQHSSEKKETKEDTIQPTLQTEATVKQFTEITAEGTETVTEVREGANTEMIMRQITEYIRVQSNPGVSEIEMQLHPASLGTVNLQLVAKETGITAQFFAENESVKAALETQITELRENLENQGFKVEAVEVAVGTYDFHSEYGNSEQSQQQESSQRAKSARIRRISLDDLAEEEAQLDEEEEITVDMMRRSGNSVDYLA